VTSLHRDQQQQNHKKDQLMDSITKFVFIALGTAFALTGIILFAKKDDKSRNTIKALRFEFSISGSSLVIFIFGFVLIIFPFTDWVHEDTPRTQPNTASSFAGPNLEPWGARSTFDFLLMRTGEADQQFYRRIFVLLLQR
jgi:hypothetical protein